ncbi:MAG: phosphoglycerol transferase MdoB-like AlkP superfamily enzyme, partial [Gammaproteobacteria bacterium]
AQHVGSLGGEIGLMPNLDALSTEGIYFKNAYASGTRSINGIAGLVAGFPPLAGSGVVKRDKAQEGFFNISTLLKQFGYQSSFFYGGESRFDNMKSWFSGNGFDRIIEESDFEDPIFSGTWGVSDLDLVIKADEYFNNWNRQAQPFVSVVFSATNHSPFEYPENIIEPVAGVPTKHVKNTIKFADHAIGVLIDRARKNGYLEDTIFAVVADHNVRVYGDDKIPVSMYRIPALIMGGGIQPRSIERRVSQPDILATLVDLLGISATHPIMGHSIYSQPEATFSYFKYHDTYGLRKKDKIAILQPNQQAQTFLLDQSDNLLPAEQDHELNKDALAMLLSLQHIYQNRMYQ